MVRTGVRGRRDGPRGHRLLGTVMALALAVGLSVSAGGSAAGQQGDAGKFPADVHTYLEDPQRTGEGQEPPHALLRQDDARRWERSLDGQWRLWIAERPALAPEGFWREGYDPSGWQQVKVPHTWQTDDLDHPVFRNVQSEMVPDAPPKVPREANPTGAYVRDVDVPKEWDGRRQVLRFDGVTSGWFLWVNGKYVGYDQGGYVPAEFDVTDFLKPGRNRVALQVHRWSAGSYLEDYDQWRYAGIFRSVTLRSTPRTRMEDARITTDLDARYRDATLRAQVRVEGEGAEGREVSGTLLDPNGRAVGRLAARVRNGTADLSAPVRNPAKWSDETPALYALKLVLHDARGRVVQSVRQNVGFREIDIKDKQLRLNGKRVLIRGVNRAETDPDTGRHATRQRMEQDVALMKRLNVNAIRTSHYPSDPYLYDLADRAGILIDDEMEVETHSHESCPQDCLADRPEWQKPFLERHRGMVERDKNHPSVIMWDTGNEAGLGRAHYAMAEWTRKADPTRPLYHQSNSPDGDAPFADISGPRYPTPAGLREKAKTFTKPIVMGEYAHAMGNSLGNFREFWEVVRAHPNVQGGFIWDWAEQNIRRPLITTPDSSRHRIAASLSGRPEVVPGYRGQALELSGLDDFVETYRDRALDLTGSAVTLDARIKPLEPWTGDFTVLSKGEQYVLRMKDARTLEFTLTGGGQPRTVTAPVPADWAGAWHRVTGVYDGTALRLYADGKQLAATPYTGRIDYTGFDLGIGRNSDTMEDGHRGHTARGTVDQVRVYGTALGAQQLAAGQDPKDQALLALDFDRFEKKGSYLSYGLYESGVDGLVTADREPQPETAQLAWVQAPIRITDGKAREGRVEVTSERAFSGTGDLALRWEVTEGAEVVASGTRPLDVAPGTTAAVRLPVPADDPGGFERQLTVRAVTVRDADWAKAGHTVSFGQFAVGGDKVPGPPATLPATGGAELTVWGDTVKVTGKAGGEGFAYTFDRKAGTLASMRSGGRELLTSGPELDVWRNPISNERSDWGTAESKKWRALGLDRLRTTVDATDTATGPDGTVTVTVRSTAAAPDVTGASFGQTMTYLIDGSGAVRVRHQVEPRGEFRKLSYLPRVGIQLRMPQRYDTFQWYGRGPVENFNDRKDGTPMGTWSTSVRESYVNYVRPQEHGNHDDVRWAALSDGRTGGLLVSGDFEASATAHDDLDRAAYPHQVRRNDGWHTLHADHAVTGVGDTPNPVRPEYRVAADRSYDYTLTLRPLTGKEAEPAR
ncbi:glycoside hydrolase family 2 TIM barrel-domain containing protein [Streptomyces sp. NPDC004111]|uniref:glycoside hydrolase family 2 TIM barrel-domain containing protein n=1 Tax=Streptomyces sp. NPDC004111 TaxID=3364690 RepID=UPI0036A7FD65